jgi:hypothetical protein
MKNQTNWGRVACVAVAISILFLPLGAWWGDYDSVLGRLFSAFIRAGVCAGVGVGIYELWARRRRVA